jgi:hypothetical protein
VKRWVSFVVLAVMLFVGSVPMKAQYVDSLHCDDGSVGFWLGVGLLMVAATVGSWMGARSRSAIPPSPFRGVIWGDSGGQPKNGA